MAEVLRAQLNEPPPPLSRFNRSLPIGTQAVLDRALAKRPADRFATANGMIEALNIVAQHAAGSPIAQPPPRPAAPSSNVPSPVYQQPVKPTPAQVSRSVSPAPPARRLTPLPPQGQPARSSNLGLWIAFLGLLLLIAALIAYLVLAGQTNTSGASGSSATPTHNVTAQNVTPGQPTVTPAVYNGPLRPRNGPDYTGLHFDTPPVIDGKLNEWQKDSGIVVNAAINLIPGLPRSNKWGGPGDLSGISYEGWDAQNFYLAVSVTDNVHVQTSTGGDLYKGDHVELWLDTDLAGDFNSTAMDGDDYQIGLSPGDFANIHPEAYIWTNRDPALIASIKVAATARGSDYLLEAAIPWTTLNFQPAAGKALGFDIDYSDTDTPGAAVQELMLSSSPHRSYNDPTSWGNLFLK